MAIGARPRISILGVLAVQLALLTAGAVLDGFNRTHWHSLRYGLFCALLLAWVFAWLWNACSNTGSGPGHVAEAPDDEDRRGLWAIVMVAAALLSLMSVVARILKLVGAPEGPWNWLGLLWVLVLVLLATWFAAREWTRSVFAVTLLAFVGVGGTGLFVLGSLVTLDSSMGALVSSTRKEVVQLSKEEQAKIDSDAEAAGVNFDSARKALREAAQPLLDARAKATAKATANPEESVLDPIAKAAEDLLRTLEAAGDDPIAVDRKAAKTQLAALLAEADPPGHEQQVQTVRTAASAAVAAIPDPKPELTDHLKVDAAVSALDACRTTEKCHRTDVAVRAHKVKVALAQYKAQLAPGDAALRAAAVKLLDADPEPLTTSPAAAISAGGNTVVGSFGSTRRPLVEPGPIGWAVIGMCVILYLRWLLTVNNAQMPGPVNIEALGKPEDKDPLTPTFEIAVLKNLPGAGSTPGSSVVGAAADLVSAADEKAGPLMKAIKAAWSVLLPPAGYTVSASIEPLSLPTSTTTPESPASTPTPPPPSSAARPEGNDEAGATGKKPTRVFVTVKTAATGETLKSEAFVEDSGQAAARAAGLGAAAFILGRSSRVPSWERWSAASATALATASSPDPTLEELAKASRAAPTSGLTLALYAGKLELKGRRLDAIEVYSRAVANHPRYMVARYRLAAALCMSTRGEDVEWRTASPTRRAAVKAAVGTAVARLGLTLAPGIGSADSVVEETAIRALGVEIFETIKTDHGATQRWASNLRQSERSKNWRRALRSGNRASAVRMKWLAKSGILVNSVDDVGSLLTEITAEADDPNSSFQVSYNLTCYYAVRPETEGNLAKALQTLEQCLVRPKVESLRSDWVRTDPDLASLVGDPRFELFLAQLAGGGEP